jgi:hypothetical protein
MSSLDEEATNYLLNHKENINFIKDELENIKRFKKLLQDNHMLGINHLLSCIKLMSYLDNIPLSEDIISMMTTSVYQKPISFSKDIITGNFIKIVRHLSEEETTTNIRLDLLSYKILSSPRWIEFKKILFSEVSPNFNALLLFLEQETLNFLERTDVNENIKIRTIKCLENMKKYDSLIIYDVFNLIKYIYDEEINILNINCTESLVDSNTFKNFIENRNNSKCALEYLQDIGKSSENTRLVDIFNLTLGHTANNPVFQFLFS